MVAIHTRMPTIYIGFDEREKLYYDVLASSIKEHTKDQYNIVPIVQDNMRRIGLFSRSYTKEGIQNYDNFDKKPFSTEFSFTRFLVPFLNGLDGLALFMDADMFVRSDITEVFDTYKPVDGPISCVQHEHVPEEGFKMDAKIQTIYRRKNWSSFVLWDCSNPFLKSNFTTGDVNNKAGSWLHAFEWVDDMSIGEIPLEWNWLDGTSPEDVEAKNVHFTTGGPLFGGWIAKRPKDQEYAQEWSNYANYLLRKQRNGE